MGDLGRTADLSACSQAELERMAAQLSGLPAVTALVNSVDGGGGTALHHAATSSCVEVARVCIAAGAAVDAREKSYKTPLHEAARHGSLEILDALVAAGARSNPHKINNWVCIVRGGGTQALL